MLIISILKLIIIKKIKQFIYANINTLIIIKNEKVNT